MPDDFQTPAPHPQDDTLPRISVLVMGHNQEAFMEDCIDSILSQDYPGWVEVVLCDDCSTDSTYDIMLRKAQEYKGPFSVIAHRCPVNGRVAVNMNVAVSLSHGDWLMRVDGDDMMHQDRLRLTALAIRRFPGTMGVSGARSCFSGRPVRVQNPPDDELEFIVGDRFTFQKENAPDRLSWWGCAMTYSRRIFTEFGDLPAVCAVLDDTMFATRIMMLGQFVIIRNGYLVYYRRHAGNISASDVYEVSLRAFLRDDRDSRDYYRRGIPCHQPILDELNRRAAQDPSCRAMADWFAARFTELKRQAGFWQKSWAQRIADAHIRGAWWRKIPWAIRVMCPLTYILPIWWRVRRRKVQTFSAS